MSKSDGNTNFTVILFFRWLFWAGNLTCWSLILIYGFKWEGNKWAHVEMIGGLTFVLLQIVLYRWSGTSPGD